MKREWAACLTTACLAATTVLCAEEGTRAHDGNALVRFLARAKLEGYASGDPKRVQRLADGGSEVRSEANGFTYRDRWYGEERFSGEELVWHEGRLVWSMNFYGASVPGAPEAFPRFHKKALRHSPLEAPLRGPAVFREGDFVYVNSWTGTLSEFEGTERVYFKDQEIFRLAYHGGSL